MQVVLWVVEVVFKKIKNFMQSKATKKEIELDSGYGCKLVLTKNGETDENFDILINKLINDFKEDGFINEEYAKEILSNKEKLIISIPSFSEFSLILQGILPENTGLRYNLFKKNFQLYLAKNPKFKNYSLGNVMYYKLNEHEKISPINFIKIVSNLCGAVSGTKIDVKQPDLLPKKEFIKMFKEVYKTDFYLNFKINFYFPELNKKFYEKVRKLLDYLIKKKLAQKQVDKKDMQKRYQDAINDYKKNFINDMMEKRIEEAKAKEIADKDLLKFVNLTYIFNTIIEGIELEDFMNIEDEFFKELQKVSSNLEYEIEINSFSQPIFVYGCFIFFQSKLKE